MENSQQVQVNFCFRPNPRWRVRNIQWLIISHKSTWIGASDNVVQWNHVARSKSVTPTSRDAHNLCSYGDGHQPWQHGAISNLPKFISSATRCWKHRPWPSPWAPITPNQNLNTKNMMKRSTMFHQFHQQYLTCLMSASPSKEFSIPGEAKAMPVGTREDWGDSCTPIVSLATNANCSFHLILPPLPQPWFLTRCDDAVVTMKTLVFRPILLYGSSWIS